MAGYYSEESRFEKNIERYKEGLGSGGCSGGENLLQELL